MNFTNMLRKNIGTIVACLGFVLLCIVTFGDLGEIFSEAYWESVRQNLLGISFVSIGLTFIQTSIRQGVAEQALQKGLNTERTTQKYEEHRAIIKANNDKQIYLPYFLQIYNKKHTKLRKQEYLVNNNYSSVKTLYATGKQRLINGYEKIRVHITVPSIKWSTIDVIYDKNSRIITLDEYRKQRAKKSLISSFIAMIGTTFVAGGLFFSPSDESLWQKFVKLFTYCLAIGISVIFTVVKEYEKGAFGVPNDLDEINQIWHEFEIWEIPEWVINEVEELNKEEEVTTKEQGKEGQRTVDSGTNIQEKQDEGESVYDFSTGGLVPVSFTDNTVLLPDGEKQRGQCDGDTGASGQEELHGCPA